MMLKMGESEVYYYSQDPMKLSKLCKVPNEGF